MKNGEILELYDALNKICSDEKIDLGVTTNYLLVKNKRLIEIEAQEILLERQKIINTYGSVDDIFEDKELLKVVNEKITELLNIENEIKLIKIPLNKIKDGLNIKYIDALWSIIKEEE